MDGWMKGIREKTAGMGRAEKFDYIVTYYWYYMLGIAAVFLLVVIFAGHWIFGAKPPLFSCVAVNCVADDVRDGRIAAGFSEWSGLPENRISIDSNYHFSYEGMRMQGVNESFYEKFFLKWGNAELDAIILEEDFYHFCKKMDGTFRNLDGFDTGTLSLYEDDGAYTAIVLDGQETFLPLQDAQNGRLLLVFPKNGNHGQECQQFIDYMKSGAFHGGR